MQKFIETKDKEKKGNYDYSEHLVHK